MFPKYPAQDMMSDPARPTAQVWRLVLGVALVLSVMFGLTGTLFALAAAGLQPDAYNQLVDQVFVADTPMGLLVLLTGMGAMGLGTILAVLVLHKRPARSLFGPLALAWRQFLQVLVGVVALYAVICLLPPWPLSAATLPGVPWGTWLLLLPLTLLTLIIQVTSEELLFRGYLQAQLAARFHHPLIWLGVPSILFGLGHYAPDTYGDVAGLVAFWALAFGLVAADLTARAGTLGPAIALHLVNNFMALAVVSMSGEMSGLALYRLPFGPQDTEQIIALMPIDLATMGLCWLTARLALRR